jgi:L-threonylcarbamoyladenylate synthase
LVGANTIPKAPGMKYKHYAPDAAMTTYVGNVDAVVQAIVDQLKTIAPSTSATDKTKVGLLISEQCWQRMKSQVATMDFAVKAITYDSKEPAQSLAKELYSSLLRFNEWNADVIIAEGVSPAGLGTAVMNRMDKASAHRVIRV